MTFSIVARDPQTGMFGIAVTTKFFGIGSLCPFARAGVGAVATQALVNPTYPRGTLVATEGEGSGSRCGAARTRVDRAGGSVKTCTELASAAATGGEDAQFNPLPSRKAL